jgi:hypothetical protein
MNKKTAIQRGPRIVPQKREREQREEALDKTVEDSFPSSDPPSSIPNPAAEDPNAA